MLQALENRSVDIAVRDARPGGQPGRRRQRRPRSVRRGLADAVAAGVQPERSGARARSCCARRSPRRSTAFSWRRTPLTCLSPDTPISSNRLYLEAAPGQPGQRRRLRDRGRRRGRSAARRSRGPTSTPTAARSGRMACRSSSTWSDRATTPSWGRSRSCSRRSSFRRASRSRSPTTRSRPCSRRCSRAATTSSRWRRIWSRPTRRRTPRRYTNPVFPASLAPSSATTGGVGDGAVGVGGEGSEADPGAAQAGSVSRDVLDFQDSTVTSLFAQAASDLNASAMSGLYNEIDTKLWVSMPTLPLFQIPSTLVDQGRHRQREQHPDLGRADVGRRRLGDPGEPAADRAHDDRAVGELARRR